MNAFVGRIDELAVLARTADAALRGEVASCIVVGDPGSGKSRLLSEAVARAKVPNQFRVVGFEPESGVPLAAASEFLRALAATTPNGNRLEELVFGAAPEDTPLLEPVRVFEAAHRAFPIGPALVLIDDLQWLDELSLALCHYLVRAGEAEGEPLALIAATRPSSAAAAFARSVRHLLPAENVTELELGPLAVVEALELVKELAPRLGDDADSRFGSRRSRGTMVRRSMQIGWSPRASAVPARTLRRCSPSLRSPRVRSRSRTRRSSVVGVKRAPGRRRVSSSNAAWASNPRVCSSLRTT
jgi:hypothetical protein